METVMVDLPFPAEHPYASHIPRYAVIPKFDSPDDPKRGVRARRDQPLHHETPATPHSIRINSKSRGGPYRWETQDLPSEGHKRALTWPGDDFYHLVKYPPDGGRQQYYPIPPKLVLPNLTERPLEKTLDPRTATALRNVEKSQWQTTYKRNFTGYGPSNELHLDNYHENMVKSMVQGKEVDDLKKEPKKPRVHCVRELQDAYSKAGAITSFWRSNPNPVPRLGVSPANRRHRPGLLSYYQGNTFKR